MSSQFFGLNIASSGLSAANAALNTTANNISNINTPGYSKRQVDQSAKNALRVYSSYGCAGSGVDVTDIKRVHDNFYDTKYRNNASNLGIVEAENYYNKIIEEYLIDDGNSGFSSIFTKFKSSIDDMIAQSDTQSKSAFISNAEELCEYFQNTYNNLQNLQKDVNKEIQISSDKINSIAKEVANLNKQINTVELSGGDINTLKDKRDLLIDELSEIINVNIKEDKVIDDKTNTYTTRYRVVIANEIELVDNYDYNQFLCIPRENKFNGDDTDGLFDIKIVKSNYNKENIDEYINLPLNSKFIGGKMEGLLAIRDGDNGITNTYQGIPYYLSQMNEWTAQFTKMVNDIFETGFDSNSNSGIALFTSNKGDFKANDLKINSLLEKDPARLAIKKEYSEGVSEYKNLTILKDALNENKIFRNTNAESYLEKVLSDAALNTSNSSTLENLYSSLKLTISNQKLSISGVDADEESMNLVKYQNAYQLSAKMIQVFSEIYDRLILYTGV